MTNASTSHGPIAVAFICDDGYIMPTCVAINSLVQSKRPETVYNIHIVCASLTEENEKTFLAFASDTVHIRILREQADRFANLHTFRKEAVCVATPAALLKFTLPSLLPEEDRVLYLDGDLLVQEDLTALSQTELGDAYLAAVVDSGSLYSGNPFIQSVEHYFNSGVMLLNLKKMREDGVEETLIRTKAQLNDSNLMDQNVFNLVCNGHMIPLPIRYNLLAVNLDRAKNKWTIDQLNDRYGTSYLDQDALFSDAAIVHFSSKDKPWKNPTVPFASKWYACMRSVPGNHDWPDREAVLKRAHITVSLTSYPGRIHCVSTVMDCLVHQTYPADRIVLYLAEEQFPHKLDDLPDDLLIYVDRGDLEIRWCSEDLKSHKKYFYAMQEYPDDLIITVDDDEMLPETTIAELLLGWLQFPNAVSARRGHLATFNSQHQLMPYLKWAHEFQVCPMTPSLQLVATGCAGILYPPHLLNKVLFDREGIESSCLFADDLWLKAVEVLSNVPVVLVTARIFLHHIDGTQDDCLYKQNAVENDVQIQQISDFFASKYGIPNLLESGMFRSDVGEDLTKIEALLLHMEYLERSQKQASRRVDGLRARLQQTFDEKSEINRKLQITYKEKFDRGVQIKELTAQVNALETKLKKAKQTQRSLRKQLEQLKRKNTRLKESSSYRIGRILTWPVRQLHRLFGQKK